MPEFEPLCIVLSLLEPTQLPGMSCNFLHETCCLKRKRMPRLSIAIKTQLQSIEKEGVKDNGDAVTVWLPLVHEKYVVRTWKNVVRGPIDWSPFLIRAHQLEKGSCRLEERSPRKSPCTFVISDFQRTFEKK